MDTVVKHLKKCPNVGRLALWGRSMGAATVLLYSSQHQEDVDCLVVDSCFTSLYALVQVRPRVWSEVRSDRTNHGSSLWR